MDTKKMIPGKRGLSRSSLVLWFFFGILAFTNNSFGALSVTGGTYTYATQTNVTTVYVQGGATISATITESGTTTWSSANWRVSTLPTSGGTTGCFNVNPNISSPGGSTTFNITAPATAGTYNGYFFASSNNSCGSTVSARFTLANSVIVDTTAPTIPTATIASNNATPTRAKTGDVVTLTFTVNDNNGLVQTPAVTISGSAATVSGTYPNFTATRTMLVTDSEGVVPFTIDVTDLAGNTATQKTAITSGSNVTFDRTAPSLSPVTIASNNATPTLAKVGDTVTLSFTSNESIQTPTVTISTHAATVSGGPTAWTATYVMAAADTAGTVPFNISFSDLAGNAGTAVTATTDASSVTFVKTPPTVLKSFSPSTIAVNGTSVLTITLTNPSLVTITGAAFTDTYPSSNLKNTASPSGATTCTGGTVTAASGGGSVTLSGGTIPVNGSCTVTVNVTATAAGSYVNTTGTVTTDAGNGTAASATLTVYGAVSPSVSTVVASPTSVPADNFTKATITATLKDSSGIPVPGKAVTLAAGSGSSVITTVSGTSDASGMATFTVKDATVQGPITYTATDTTDSIVITQTAQVTFTTPSLCFTDDFNRTDLLSTGYWTKTKGAGTTYDANIVSNRLRLTDATVVSGGEATAVHLNRLFPGAGNKVAAEFDYFVYGGSGGDGTAITLSDSSIAPVAGAFGGSLGYAQKSNPGSDCTVTGGCPGFAGGWIGVGLDEYGNYSNPTEGRIGGPGAQANSATVRGSGSGQSGYNWHRIAAVSPGIATTSTTWHRYRVTVDHSDGVHAYTSVDRDTTGTGNSYTNLIPVYDAKAISTQAAVPPYWFFSLTASTGGSANIHEIDNLNVCTAQPMVTPSLDHVRIVHDGSALTCKAETITLRACATADCSALFTGSVTVSLNAISGAAWSSNPVTFSGGQAQVTLTKATAGTVTLGGSVTAPSSMSAVCYNGSTRDDCSLAYSANACAFDAVESGQTPGAPIFTKLAGVNFTVDVLALNAGAINTGYTGTVAVDLVDQSGVAAGSCSSTSLSSCTATPGSPYTFISGNAGRRTFTFNCPNAAKDVRVRMVSGTTSACSSDNFAVRPPSFSVTSPNANNAASAGMPIIKTGAAFELDAASVTSYTGTALINSNRIAAHVGAVQTGTLSGTFSAASSATGWVSKGTAFTYSEVGSFQFSPWGVYDDGSFAEVDRGKATPECVIDNKIGTSVDPTDPNVKDGNGKYGCYFGGTNTGGGTITSPYFGRFIPDHFNTTVAQAAGVPMGCPSGLTCPVSFNGFVYSGQPFTLNVSAMNSSDVQTQNYQGGFAKAVTLSAVDAVGGTAVATAAPGGTLTAAAVPAASFTSGGTVAPGTPAAPVFTFTAIPTAPTDVYVRALDTDGVTSLRPVAANSVEGGVKIVSGRVAVPNANGSELLSLPINDVEVQYFNGLLWKTSGTDITPLAVGNVGIANCLGNLGNPAPACRPAPIVSVGSVTLANGIGSITLNAPGAGNNGSADVTLNGPGWPVWLPSTTGRATFGIYKGNSRFIYIRELY